MPMKRSGNPGFLLGAPRGYVGVRGNWLFVSAGSDLFDFITTQLTLDKRDFDTRTFGPELGIAITNRLTIVGAFELSRTSNDSEYRDFVDNSLQPINQTTHLTNNDFSAGVKYALVPFGRRVSRFAWVPSTLTPYVGAGGGGVFYRFRQTGDFVDSQDRSVFTSMFQSDGWAPTAYVVGGVDMHIYQRLYLSAQARYVWAKATLGRDFVDFEPMDLGGLRIGFGIQTVF